MRLEGQIRKIKGGKKRKESRRMERDRRPFKMAP